MKLMPTKTSPDHACLWNQVRQAEGEIGPYAYTRAEARSFVEWARYRKHIVVYRTDRTGGVRFCQGKQ